MSDASPRVKPLRAVVVFQLVLALLSSWMGLRMVGAVLLALATRKTTLHALRQGLREVLPVVLDDSWWREHCRINVLRAVCDYLMEHADAVRNTAGGRIYSDGFRRFVIGLVGPGQPGREMSSAELASATGVPLDTLEDWLRSKKRCGSLQSILE